MIYILIVIAIVAIEYKIKDYMDENKQCASEEKILADKIIINKHYNKGMFLSFMKNKKNTVTLISSFALGGLTMAFALALRKKESPLLKLGLSLMLGGAISNIIDRIKKGHVVDYFSFNMKKIKQIVFNLADMFIFLGGIILAIVSLFSSLTRGK